MKEILKSEFNEFIQSADHVVVLVHAKWSATSKYLIDGIKSVSFHDSIKIGLADIDLHSAHLREYSVRQAPSILFFRNGSLDDFIQGWISKDDLDLAFKKNQNLK